MFDLIIRKATLGAGELVDVGLSKGQIVAVEPELPAGDGPSVDAQGQLLVRGYVEPHAHLDKALLSIQHPNRSGTRAEALAINKRVKYSLSRDDIAQRARAAVQMALSNGVRAIRTHVDIDLIIGLEALHAVNEVRREFAGEVTIQVVAFPQEGLGADERVLDLLRKALDHGADIVGGLPSREIDPARHLALLFGLAKAYDLPIDMHVDESDDPAVFTLPALLACTKRFGMEGRVVVAHLCSLASVTEVQAQEAIQQMKDCGIRVVTLPSMNLYHQGRGDRGAIRRGVTRIRELLEAGIPVAAGGDNQRDPFNPFGNANPIETAWLLAHVAQMGATPDLERVFGMVSEDAAELIGLAPWSVAVGAPADLLLLPVKTRAEAVLGLVKPVWQIRRGALHEQV